ncbi:RNA 2'-phosphotransferase [Paenibacillus lutrae]|uniref:Probable RNA 2'-phosphotransferase n=1 Tax=Paenibacillus lutrae TaxID=2078573 RepID=A0A7X3FLL3_9BACL|nr:RNA 2'-phosphotransferase [Paenibacillus lutrae]MVP01863.1 RNA 2'-phosphotransferase [Paenibacillus lutrae]
MIQAKEEISLSRIMTRILRHTPEQFRIHLNEDGFCTLDELLQGLRSQKKWANIALEDIYSVVRNSDKQRFEIIGERIRARYGHSHDKISYAPGNPPPKLYHGTNTNALASILKNGISPMQRQYVHLSETLHFAELAGSRRGELVIIEVDTTQAARRGTAFYYAGNEVWLSEHVPADCCTERTGN